MRIFDIKKCKTITSADNCALKELFAPGKEKLDSSYSVAHAKLKPGDGTLLHRLESSESYYVLQGKGIMHIDGEEKEICEGQLVLIPPNSEQKIKNIGEKELVFLCIVSPPWTAGHEHILQ